MSNVPTITPGPNDTERAPEGATETLPLITTVHATQQSDSTSAAMPGGGQSLAMNEPSSRRSVPSVGAKSSSDAALRQASWPPLCSSPLS